MPRPLPPPQPWPPWPSLLPRLLPAGASSRAQAVSGSLGWGLGGMLGNLGAAWAFWRSRDPKPADAGRRALYAWIVDKPFDVAALPAKLQAYEAFKRVPVGELPVALDVDQAAQPRRRGKPQQAALEDAAAEPAEQAARDLLALLGRLFGKAQLQVAQGDAAPRAGRAPQQRAQGVAAGGLPGQRQPMEAPQESQQGVAARTGSEFFHG